MILAGLPPEKAITLASKSIKLWRYQSEAAHLYSLSKLSDVTKKYIENKHTYEKTISKMKIKYEAEIAGLRAYYDEIGTKLKRVSEQLQDTKRRLKKYQEAYSLKTSNLNGHKRMFDFCEDDNVYFSPNSSGCEVD
ncbi:uncharacterized protein [Rhodnius prolixus]|uniref:Uncharacterized protein n=1 Tax=Rhodnius prolixus TaxID=13249 RepID=T1HUW0_RHOPR